MPCVGAEHPTGKALVAKEKTHRFTPAPTLPARSVSLALSVLKPIAVTGTATDVMVTDAGSRTPAPRTW